MEEKLISVIIPTYKRKSAFGRAIKSIINQSYKNIEIIVVDDNSELEYSNYVRSYIEKLSDKRIVYIKNKKNLGGSLSRNAGILKSSGEYVAFLDDDDLYTKDSIYCKLQQFEINKDKRLALVYGWVKSIDEFGRTLRTYKYTNKGSCILAALQMSVAATSQWLCRRDALLDVGMFSNVPSQQDSTVILKLILAGYTVDYVPQILNIYCEHSGVRISSDSFNKLKGLFIWRARVRESYNLISKRDARNIDNTLSAQILKLAIKNRRYKLAFEEGIKLSIHSPVKLSKELVRPFLERNNN